jgi:hypothetical protein
VKIPAFKNILSPYSLPTTYPLTTLHLAKFTSLPFLSFVVYHILSQFELVDSLNFVLLMSKEVFTHKIFLFQISVLLPTILSGNHHIAYVAIVETSTNAATKNRLAWIKTQAIKVLLIIFIGLRSQPSHQNLKIFFITANNTINPKVKLAKFLTIFQNFHNGASK